MDAKTNPTRAALPRVRRWEIVAVAMIAVAAIAVVYWWGIGRSFSVDDQAMVGSWRIRWDGSKTAQPVEYEYRPDGTCMIRHYNPDTGALTLSSAEQTWRRMGDTLIVRYPKRVAGPWWNVFGVQRSVREVYLLTPDGPGQFRFTRAVEVGGAPEQEVSGILTRSGETP